MPAKAPFFHAFGLSLADTTPGGVAGAGLINDAVSDVENIFRRLKEGRQEAGPDSALRVACLAPGEARSGVVPATVIVCLVLPPFADADPHRPPATATPTHHSGQ